MECENQVKKDDDSNYRADLILSEIQNLITDCLVMPSIQFFTFYRATLLLSQKVLLL
jgi:hypothetical protein